MNQDKLKFTIDQLRKDKIIYATESCATSATAVLGLLFSNQYLQSPLKDFVNTLILVIAVGYVAYMGFGNYKRLQKIQDLERQLK